MTTQQSGPAHPQQPYATPYPAPYAQHPAPYAVPHPGVAPPGAVPAGYAPYAPYGSPYASPVAELVRGEAPKAVDRAFWLFLGQILLSAISLVVTIVTVLAAGGSTVIGAVTYSADAGGVVFMVVAFLVWNGVWALFAWKMREGRNWGRVVLTVFTALGVISAVFSLLSGPLLAVVAVLNLAMGITAVVLMFRPESGPWFAQR